MRNRQAPSVAVSDQVTAPFLVDTSHGTCIIFARSAMSARRKAEKALTAWAGPFKVALSTMRDCRLAHTAGAPVIR